MRPIAPAILTGQPIWRLEEAANIWSTLPAKFRTYTEELQKAGYKVGATGKSWGPGRLEPGGRTENPAGPAYTGRTLEPPFEAMRDTDYAGNFEDFMAQVNKGESFCFWLGTSEPHRAYEDGAGIAMGKDPAKVEVPPIFPDNDLVRSDILDYLVEVEHFDSMVERAIESLKTWSFGQYDCGGHQRSWHASFPRGKATVADDGSLFPLRSAGRMA